MSQSQQLNTVNTARLITTGVLIAILALPSAGWGARRPRIRNGASGPVEAARLQWEQAVEDHRRAQYTRAKVVRDLTRNFEQSGEYRQAVAEQQFAVSALEAAREQVLEELRTTTAWRQACAAYQAALARRAALAPDCPDRERIVAATDVLNTGAALRQLEQAAFDASPDVMAARERMLDATAYLGDLRAEFEQSIRETEAWQGAKEAIAAAEEAVSRAGAASAAPSEPLILPLAAPQHYSPSVTSVSTRCTSCNRSVPSTSRVGQTCPHCGAYWSFKRVNKE